MAAAAKKQQPKAAASTTTTNDDDDDDDMPTLSSKEPATTTTTTTTSTTPPAASSVPELPKTTSTPVQKFSQDSTADTAKDAEKEEEDKGALPNAGNGGTGPHHDWTQTLKDLVINVHVPLGKFVLAFVPLPPPSLRKCSILSPLVSQTCDRHKE